MDNISYKEILRLLLDEEKIKLFCPADNVDTWIDRIIMDKCPRHVFDCASGNEEDRTIFRLRVDMNCHANGCQLCWDDCFPDLRVKGEEAYFWKEYAGVLKDGVLGMTVDELLAMDEAQSEEIPEISATEYMQVLNMLTTDKASGSI